MNEWIEKLKTYLEQEGQVEKLTKNLGIALVVVVVAFSG